MAYFSNGTDGECFDVQCNKCKYGQEACPIAWVQLDFNYEASNNKVARAILDHLVSDEGECSMYKTFEKDFEEVDSVSKS